MPYTNTDDLTVGRRSELFNDGWVFVPEAVVPDPGSDPELPGEPVTLPHTWNAVDGQDGGNDYRRGASTYIKQFAAERGDDEVWVEFQGANSSADVYLNGTHLCRHDGGYSTFRCELTSALAGDNVLTVVVDNAANTTVYPQRADFTFYGGIYRDVTMITVPRSHFALDEHGGPGVVVTPSLDGSRAIVTFEATVTGGDAVRFAIGGVGSFSSAVVDGVAGGELVIDDVQRWHGVRDPHLYEATASLLVGDEIADEVSLRFGCREFAVDPDRGFILNGEEYPLRGVSRHQDWQGVGNAITNEMMLTDLALMQEVGATTVRLAHYQHDQRFYDLCDQAGIVVWAEIPQITDFLPEATTNATSQLVELIVQNRHHASIVCWGLSNEITVTGNPPALLEAHVALNELAHQLDPTRLTAMAHLFLLETDEPLVTVPDVMSYNLYFGWYVGDVADNDVWLDDFRAAHPGVAIGLSEYGADANYRVQTGTPVRGDYTEQFQAKYHEHMIEMIEARPWLWATHVWNLADFAADGRNEGGVPGRNMKGLVTFDRSVKKDAFFAYKAAWSDEPFVHIAGRRYVDRPEDTTEVTVYSNQSEVSLWVDGNLIGTSSGPRVFRFAVPLTGEHELTARSETLSDSIVVRRVDEPNPDYSVPATEVANWFDTVDLPSPAGFYSIEDTMVDIKSSAEAAPLIEALMKKAAAGRGDVAQDVEIPESVQKMVDRMSVKTLLGYAGPIISPEDVATVNAALNRIPK
jgi:beta-galactosidase